MLKYGFDSIQCLLICYKTFKECREYVLKRHFVYLHFNINNLNHKARKEFFNKQKTIFRKVNRLVGKRGNFRTKSIY